MPNPLSNRFSGADLPPGTPAYAGGAVLGTPVTPTSTAMPAPAAPSLADRAKALMQRAYDGMSSLLGRPVQPPDRTAQLEAQLNALQQKSTPNILSTIPRLAPLVTQPAVPVGTPKPAPTPYSLNGWLAAQNSKGS